MSSSTSTIRPFGIRDKVGYLFGDFGNDFMFIFASSFLMVFYTKVMGVPGTIVGTLFLVARILDAFADVTVGIVVDRAKPGPHGKYRPVMMKMAVPAVIFSFLMYQTFCINQSMGVKIVYMSVTYIIWGFLYSCVNIPYGSMASVISLESEHRTSLSTFRTIGATFAQLIVGVVAPLIIYTADENGNQIIRDGEHTQIFMIVSAVFAIASLACYFTCYSMTVERVKTEHHTANEGESPLQSVLAMVKGAVSSRSMVGLISSAIALLMAMLFLQQMANYLYTDYFGDAKLLSIANMFGVVMTLVLAPFVQPLTKVLGRKGIGILGAAIGTVGMFVLYVLHTTNAVLFIVIYIISFIGIGLFNLVVFAMVTDVIDDIEVTKSVREDATCYSVYSFARKLGQAFAGWFAGVSIDWIGYQEGATAVQSQETLDGLYTFSTLLPAIFFLVMLLIMVFVYPLDKNRVAKNTEILKAKRQVGATE